MSHTEKKFIPNFLVFCLLLWLLIGSALSLELIDDVMKTLPLLRVSSGFILTVSLWLVFGTLVLIKFVSLARHLFVMGLWLLTVMSAPGAYLLIQFLERQGVSFATGGVIYLIVYIFMVLVVLYSSAVLNRGGMSASQIKIVRTPIMFVSTISFFLICVSTLIYVPILVKQCGSEKIYRYRLGIYACDLEPRKERGKLRVLGCYKNLVSFDQDPYVYFRLQPSYAERCP